MCCAAGWGPEHRAIDCHPLPLGPLPVEPLFCREAVTLLVPVKSTTLARWITRNPGVLSGPWYTGKRTRRRRLFSAGDIKLLRAALVHPTP
jgi:hypothetical protein